MITLTYVLLFLGAALVIAAGAMVARNRLAAFALLACAVMTGVAVIVTSSFAVSAHLPPSAYRAVRDAAAQDGEVDAAAQWALSDNEITPSEYGEIAQIYRERTGRELNDLVRKERGK